jgi:hypothetical protein
MSHHQIAKATDVVVVEIASEVAISLAHSQYDKQIHSKSAECRTPSSSDQYVTAT